MPMMNYILFRHFSFALIFSFFIRPLNAIEIFTIENNGFNYSLHYDHRFEHFNFKTYHKNLVSNLVLPCSDYEECINSIKKIQKLESFQNVSATAKKESLDYLYAISSSRLDSRFILNFNQSKTQNNKSEFKFLIHTLLPSINILPVGIYLNSEKNGEFRDFSIINFQGKVNNFSIIANSGNYRIVNKQGLLVASIEILKQAVDDIVLKISQVSMKNRIDNFENIFIFIKRKDKRWEVVEKYQFNQENFKMSVKRNIVNTFSHREIYKFQKQNKYFSLNNMDEIKDRFISIVGKKIVLEKYEKIMHDFKNELARCSFNKSAIHYVNNVKHYLKKEIQECQFIALSEVVLKISHSEKKMNEDVADEKVMINCMVKNKLIKIDGSIQSFDSSMMALRSEMIKKCYDIKQEHNRLRFFDRLTASSLPNKEDRNLNAGYDQLYNRLDIKKHILKCGDNCKQKIEFLSHRFMSYFEMYKFSVKYNLANEFADNCSSGGQVENKKIYQKLNAIVENDFDCFVNLIASHLNVHSHVRYRPHVFNFVKSIFYQLSDKRLDYYVSKERECLIQNINNSRTRRLIESGVEAYFDHCTQDTFKNIIFPYLYAKKIEKSFFSANYNDLNLSQIDIMEEVKRNYNTLKYTEWNNVFLGDVKKYINIIFGNLFAKSLQRKIENLIAIEFLSAKEGTELQSNVFKKMTYALGNELDNAPISLIVSTYLSKKVSNGKIDKRIVNNLWMLLSEVLSLELSRILKKKHSFLAGFDPQQCYQGDRLGRSSTEVFKLIKKCERSYYQKYAAAVLQQKVLISIKKNFFQFSEQYISISNDVALEVEQCMSKKESIIHKPINEKKDVLLDCYRKSGKNMYLGILNEHFKYSKLENHAPLINALSEKYISCTQASKVILENKWGELNLKFDYCMNIFKNNLLAFVDRSLSKQGSSRLQGFSSFYNLYHPEMVRFKFVAKNLLRSPPSFGREWVSSIHSKFVGVTSAPQFSVIDESKKKINKERQLVLKSIYTMTMELFQREFKLMGSFNFDVSFNDLKFKMVKVLSLSQYPPAQGQLFKLINESIFMDHLAAMYIKERLLFGLLSLSNAKDGQGNHLFAKEIIDYVTAYNLNSAIWKKFKHKIIRQNFYLKDYLLGEEMSEYDNQIQDIFFTGNIKSLFVSICIPRGNNGAVNGLCRFLKTKLSPFKLSYRPH